MGERWGRIGRAYHKGDELAAVGLHKIGDAYFVRDGNHRVSVARYHGVVEIDAEVVELRGQIRTDAAQSAGYATDTPTHRPQHPPEPDVSWLHNMWQRLRPGLTRPEPRPVS